MPESTFRKVSKLSYPVQLFFGMVSFLAPLWIKKKHGNVVMSSFHGDGFRGNTATLFEHLVAHDELSPVWLSRNAEVVREINARYGAGHAFLSYSWQGVKALASSAFILFTHGTSDFPFLYLPRRAHKIQTYHGLPTKRGEYMQKEGDPPLTVFKKLQYWHRYRNIDWFLSSSPIVSQLFSQRFRLPLSRYVITGYPATDRLVRKSKDSERLRRMFPSAATESDTRVILYAPTFRTQSPTRWFPFDDFNLQALCDFLEEKNAILLLRSHPNMKGSLQVYTKASGRILDAGQHVFEDVFELLTQSDVVITDYSSIALEALLGSIPPIYLPYDRESYERGFPLPYDEVTPGPKPATFADFLHELHLALPEEGISLPAFEADRKRVTSMFFTQRDGKSTERVIGFLEDLMQRS